MKELSIEEKAKRYDEAIKKAESLYKAAEPMSGCNVIIETLFPELRESEDERIRKTLREMIIRYNPNNEILIKEEGISKKQFIALLEKPIDPDTLIQQRVDALADIVAEQKPTDKVEPKFKIGDKIYLKPEYRMPDDDTPIANTVSEIRAIDDKHYKFDGSYIFIEDQDKYELVEQKTAEWSNICEFSLKTWNDIVAYVLKEHNGIGNYLDDSEVKDTAEKLQKKYKFDAASEEWDRVYRRGLDAGINYGKTEALRVQAPVGWSEEDEKFINRSILYLKKYSSSDSEVERRSAQSCINWLEALRDDKLNDSSIVKYKEGDKVRFFSYGEVFTISKVENGKYIFADGGGDISVYEELIPVKESKDTLTRDKVKCGDYVVDKDGTVIKVHDIDNFGHVCYYYFANEMTEDGGKIQDNRAFMKYYGIIQDCRMATQSEIDFLEKWVAHKKYIWVEDNVSPDDEEED